MRTILCLGVAILLLPGAVRAGDEKPILDAKGEITAKDDFDKKLTESHCKVHVVKLEGGKTYRIDLTSGAFDTFLRLEDKDGKELAFDDDGGEGLNSRLSHEVAKDKGGEYRVIVTTFDGAKTGAYRLTINVAGKLDGLESKLKRLFTLPPDEQAATLAEFRKMMAEKGKDIGLREAGLAMNVAIGMETRGDPKVATEVYLEFAKALAQGSDPKVSSMAKMMEGASRRMNLIGNKIEVKGEKLDGKAFDWSAYKGKVVLVDFWATWCGPCVAEVPNIKNMYEKYHKRGFDVVGISIDATPELAAKFMEAKELPWACIFDGRSGAGKERLSDFYGVFFIPQAILVDRDGRVVTLRARGAELGRQLEKLIPE